MIGQIAPDDPLLQLVGGHPFIAANIGGRAACPQPEQDFWIVWQGGEAVGFLCRVGETLYATAQQAQAEEIAQFAVAIGFRWLMSDIVLPLEGNLPLLAMECGGTPPDCEQDTVGLFTEPCPQFSSVAFAKLQQRCGALTTAEETQHYAVTLSHEMRKGGGAAVTMERDDKLVAGASICHIYRGMAVLGAVAVLPQYRGQGLGRTIAAAACQAVRHLGYSPFLCCNPALEQFYRLAGFVPSLPIYCYTCRPTGQNLKGTVPK